MTFVMDAFRLARAQFAFTVAFHIIFPAFSIGLASFLAVLEGLWLWTKRPVGTVNLTSSETDFRISVRLHRPRRIITWCVTGISE